MTDDTEIENLFSELLTKNSLRDAVKEFRKHTGRNPSGWEIAEALISVQDSCHLRFSDSHGAYQFSMNSLGSGVPVDVIKKSLQEHLGQTFEDVRCLGVEAGRRGSIREELAAIRKGLHLITENEFYGAIHGFLTGSQVASAQGFSNFEYMRLLWGKFREDRVNWVLSTSTSPEMAEAVLQHALALG